MMATVLLILALVAFVLAAANYPVNPGCCRLLGIGLALWVLAQLLPALRF